MTEARNAKLKDALCNAIIVRFWNPYEQGSIEGYVLDIGPKFFLLGLIDENRRFNGFQCMLISEVKRLKVPAPYEQFIVAALRKLKQRIDRKPDIDLSSLPALLKSADGLFPLVTIYRERIKPDECVIGSILKLFDNSFLMLTIGPDAVWDERPTRFRLSDVTRVEFGGGYEEALHLVGGSPRPLKDLKRKKRS